MYGPSLFPSDFFEHNSQRDEGQDFLDRVQIRNKVHIFGTDINIQRKQIDLGVCSGSERRSQFVLFLFDPVQIPEPEIPRAAQVYTFMFGRRSRDG